MMIKSIHNAIPTFDRFTQQDMFGIDDAKKVRFRLEIGLWLFAEAGWNGSNLQGTAREYCVSSGEGSLFDLADHFQAHLTTTTAAAMVQSQ